MKTAVLWSSPNRDGLTAAAKDRMIAGLKKAGVEVDEIHLNSMHIEHCRAGACRGNLRGETGKRI
ncbi:MAG: hypothetical protein MJ142_02855 [Clostridia bacterium]|nr:hypothetical protein [Clostridia bacterium]